MPDFGDRAAGMVAPMGTIFAELYAYLVGGNFQEPSHLR